MQSGRPRRITKAGPIKVAPVSRKNHAYTPNYIESSVKKLTPTPNRRRPGREGHVPRQFRSVSLPLPLRPILVRLCVIVGLELPTKKILVLQSEPDHALV